MRDVTDSDDAQQRLRHNHHVIDRALRWYRTESAPLTVYDRRLLWHQLAQWLDDHHQTTIDQATKQQLQDWRESLRVSPRSEARMISGVHRLYWWMCEIAEIRTDDPSRQLTRPRRVKRDNLAKKAMTEADFFLALQAAVHDPELVVLLLLGRFLGLRRCELSRLRVCDVIPRIDQPGAWIDVHGKGDQWRRLPCPPQIHKLLKPFLRGQGYVFTKASGDPHTPRDVGRKVNRHLRELGITHRLHATRHACATRTLQGGANVRQVQQLLGHSSLEEVATYAEVEPDELAAVVDLLTRKVLEQHGRTS
jgi:site-specific recombinase XerD